MKLYHRSIAYYRRTNLAVLLGVIAGGAALTGALIVGDSMRGSLRDLALRRLGDVSMAFRAQHFFRAKVGGEYGVPIILRNGSAGHPDSGRRVNSVDVFGVNADFWELEDQSRRAAIAGTTKLLSGRVALLSDALAEQLGAQPGDDVILRIGKPSVISTETLLGRRDASSLRLRLTVAGIVPSDTLAGFSLNPRQYRPPNAFVPLEVLQHALGEQDRANALLVPFRADSLVGDTRARFPEFADVGLRLISNENTNTLVLESEAMLLAPPIEQAVEDAAKKLGAQVAPVISYLANEIALLEKGGVRFVVPYSTVAAIDPSSFVLSDLPNAEGAAPLRLLPGETLLNQWTAEQLRAEPGDTIRLTYFVASRFGNLVTETATFRVSGIVAMRGAGADSTFTPEYPGVTDAKRISDWDPPFPVDLGKVREVDEDYWDQYRGAPKAFITVLDGERLWGEADPRLGRYTSYRLKPPSGMELAELAQSFETRMLSQLTPRQLGLGTHWVRDDALRASSGSTDFGGLFFGFSLFLIASAAMLTALLFRLGIERRARDVGTQLALGFTPRQVRGQLLAEGAAIAAIGSLIGLAAAIGYAWLMLAGLRTWWAAAANAPFLTLHLSAGTFVIGFVLSFLVPLASIAWSVRGLTLLSPRALLAGAVQAGSEIAGAQRGRIAGGVAVVAFALGAVLLALGAATEVVPKTAGFFGGGSLLMIGCLAIVRLRLTREPGRIVSAGRYAVIRLGLRNAPRHLGRSMLTVCLIASATFVVAALGAFRIDADTKDYARSGGTGGYSLYAEATTPLVYDLNTAAGRESLNISPAARHQLESVRVTPYRLRGGDASSCLNLYLPTQPRIIGAPHSAIERGGFRFASTLEVAGADASNPWKLLEAPLPGGAVPVIGDAAAVMWQLHSGLGHDFVIQDERGNDVRLRFVALLDGSILQDELIIAESQFKRLFPSIDGYGFFLIEADPATTALVEQTLERELSSFGFDAARTADRLRDYLAVQNTYITTFQTLGGLGLVLGTVGLIAILLRNVWERRRELALMQAVGFSRGSIVRLVLAENAALVIAGLLAGAVPALIAVAPLAFARPLEVPWGSLGFTLAGVLLIGIGVAWAALAASLRTPLLPALRNE